LTTAGPNNFKQRWGNKRASQNVKKPSENMTSNQGKSNGGVNASRMDSKKKPGGVWSRSGAEKKKRGKKESRVREMGLLRP